MKTNTKTLWLLLLLPIFHACDSSDDSQPDFFEGKVTYKYIYSSDSLDVDSLADARPSHSRFFFRGDDYRSIFFGENVNEYVYFGGVGMGYSRQDTFGIFTEQDYKIFTDSVLSYRVIEEGGEEFGMPCRVIEIEGKYFKSKFHCAKNLHVSPGSYELHNAYNWSFLMGKAEGGLVLKAVHEFPTFTMRSMAVEVEEMDVPDEMFVVRY